MKRIIFLLTIFSSGSLWAEWTYSAYLEETGDKYYVDYSTIESNKSLVYAWNMTDLVKPDLNGALSFTSLYELKCNAPKQYRIISFQAYNLPMAEDGLMGSVNPDTDWEYLLPGSVIDIMVSDICSAD